MAAQLPSSPLSFSPSVAIQETSVLGGRKLVGLQSLSRDVQDEQRLGSLNCISTPFLGSRRFGGRIVSDGAATLTRGHSPSPAALDSASTADVKVRRRTRLSRRNASVLADSSSSSSSSRDSTAVSALGSAVAEAPITREVLAGEFMLDGTLRLAEESASGEVSVDELAATLEVLYNGHPAPAYRLPYEAPTLQQMLEGGNGRRVEKEGMAVHSKEESRKQRREEGEGLSVRDWVDAASVSCSLLDAAFRVSPSAAAKTSRRKRRVALRVGTTQNSANGMLDKVADIERKPRRRTPLVRNAVAEERVNLNDLIASGNAAQASRPKQGRKKKGVSALTDFSSQSTSDQSLDQLPDTSGAAVALEALSSEGSRRQEGDPGEETQIPSPSQAESSTVRLDPEHIASVKPPQEATSSGRTSSRVSPPARNLPPRLEVVPDPTSSRPPSLRIYPLSRTSSSGSLSSDGALPNREEKESGPSVGIRIRTARAVTRGRQAQALELLKARGSSKAKQLKPGRRLSLSSRIRLSQKKTSAERGMDRSLRKWEGVTLSGTAGEMSAEELEELVREYGEFRTSTSQWMKTRVGNLELEEQMRLGFLIQPAKALEKLRRQLGKDLGRDPTAQEWAHAAGVSPSTLQCQLALREAARNKLMQHHVGLVLMMAHHLHNRSLSFTVQDLCQLGIQGLADGTDKWDPSKGIRFMVYIKYWVKNAILRGITTQGHFLRAPVHMGQDNLNIKRAQLELQMALGRPATLAEVAAKTGLKAEKCQLVLQAFRAAQSLNQIDPVSGLEQIESLTRRGDGIDLGCDNPQIRFAIDDVLDSLKPRESLVLRQRFGLDGGGQRSFGEISKVLNCSREMVRKYEMQGLAKMRHPQRMEYLRSHIME